MLSISRIKLRASSLLALGAVFPVGAIACSGVNDGPDLDASSSTTEAVASTLELPSARAFASAEQPALHVSPIVCRTARPGSASTRCSTCPGRTA